MNEGEFKKRIVQKSNDHCHLLDDLTPHINETLENLDAGTIHINTEKMTMKMWDVLGIVDEAKQDIGNLTWIRELQDYLQKYAPTLDNETPIFSARHFKQKLDEHKEKLMRWFGE